LIHVVQRGESANQQVSYGTTTRFLELFHLQSLDDLPQTQDLQKLGEEGNPMRLPPMNDPFRVGGVGHREPRASPWACRTSLSGSKKAQGFRPERPVLSAQAEGLGTTSGNMFRP
jgi:hypothetical protein